MKELSYEELVIIRDLLATEWESIIDDEIEALRDESRWEEYLELADRELKLIYLQKKITEIIRNR